MKKNIQRAFSALLVVVLLLTAVPFSTIPVMAEENYVTAKEAVVQLREQMKQREESSVVYVDLTAEEFSTVPVEIRDAAFSHTGNPKEGDYILWQYANCSCDANAYSEDGVTYHATLTYTTDFYTTAEQEAEMDAKVAAVLEELDLSGASDYEKVCGIYDYICENVVYDHENLNDKTYKLKHTAYAALIDGKSVCQGYALLFYRLALELGVDARVIAGVGNGGRHAWNIVKLGESYYNVDATWDAGRSKYAFFLRGSENFTDHVSDGEYLETSFTENYPISETDYVPKADEEEEGYIYGDYLGDLKWKYKDGVFTIYGNGPIPNNDVSYNYTAPWDEQARWTHTLVIEEGVTTIGYKGIFEFSWIRTLELPSTVTFIDGGAYYCTDLKHVFYGGTDAQWDAIDFDGADRWIQNVPRHSTKDGITSSVNFSCTKEAYFCTECGVMEMENAWKGHSFTDGICTNCGVEEKWTYTINDDATVTITDYNGTDTELYVPATIENFPVTTINFTTSNYNQYVFSMILPENVTTILALDSYDFAELRSITLPISLKKVEEDAFDAFKNYSKLNHVLYAGTAKQWGEIDFGFGNRSLLDAPIHYETGNIVSVDVKCTGVALTCEECGLYCSSRKIYDAGHTTTDTDPICTVCGAHTGWGYEFLENGTVAFGGYHGGGNFTIPETIEGVPVCEIGRDYGYDLYCDVLIIPTTITKIDRKDSSWTGYCNAKHVLYLGSEEQWNAIEFGDSNSPILNIERHYHAAEITVTVEETCTEKIYTCSECGLFLTEAQNKHKYTSVVTPPTCAEKGYTTYTCTKCGYSYKSNETSKLSHTYGEEVKVPPTCVDYGYTIQTCTECGYEKKTNGSGIEDRPTGFHTEYEEIIEEKAATCTETGYRKYRCSVCGNLRTQNLAALKHSYATGLLEPTCSEVGYYYTYCTNEGCDYKQGFGSIIPALGHDYQAVVTEPTCETDGYTTYTCNNCGDTYVDDIVVTSGHDYSAIVAPPGCEYGGYTLYTCDICGDGYVDDETAATGHTTVIDLAVEPTCIDSGLTEGSHCGTCGTVFVAQEVVAPLGDAGHEYVGAICGYCGDIRLTAPVVTASNTASSGKIKLTWDAVAGAESYKIYRATSKTGTYSLMKTTTSTSYTNTSAAVGKTYYYYVVAICDDLTAKSAIVSRTCDLPYTTVTATNVSSSGKVKLSWTKVDGAVKYEVYRATSKSGTYSLIKSTTSASYTDSSAKAGTTYYYKVKALAEKSAANSAYSSIVSRTCDLPSVTGLAASNDAATGKIELAWDAVSGAKEYAIYRATSESGTYSSIGTATEEEYLDTTAKAGKKYYYKVKAIASNSAANGAYSSVVSCTCDLPRPVLATENVASSGKIKVSWDEIDGAAKYEIYRATSKTGTYSLLKTTTSESYTDTSAKAGKSYYYKVKAIASSSSANSAYSSAKSRTCDLAQAKLTVSGVESSGKPKLTWDKVTDAKEYKVYRSTSKDGTYTCIKTTTSTSYTDSSAVAGTKYYYKVRAISSNTSAHGAYSSAIARTCDLARPTVSINLSSGKPKVSWDAVEGAVEYKVYRATSKSGTYSLVKTTTSKSYTDSSAKKGTTYYYKVVAVAKNTAANSAYSSVVSIKAIN